MTTTTFKELGLPDYLLNAIEKKGFTEPSDIQQKVIPYLLNNDDDIIAKAQTGTGKTAAYGLPLLHALKESSDAIQALILTPTRELAIQVADELNSFKGTKKCSILPIYGGQSISVQIKALKRPHSIIVGTPGRVIDHLQSKRLDFKHVSHIILDEADEMLNKGFIEDIEFILSLSNSSRQTLLFSATMTNEIKKLAQKYMKNQHTIETKAKETTAPSVKQCYYEVHRHDQLNALCRLIDVSSDFYGIVFCNTKREVDDVSEKLIQKGYSAEALHGDLSQQQRNRVLAKFKSRGSTILFATDVASRGIDIQDLTYVVNFGLPQDLEAYVHRIGRTGRAGKTGTAITLIPSSDFYKLRRIEKALNFVIEKKRIPSTSQIIDTKKAMISQHIEATLSTSNQSDFSDLATELMNQHNPVDIVSTLLNLFFKKELDPKNYPAIDDLFDAKARSYSKPYQNKNYRSDRRRGNARPFKKKFYS